MPTPSTLTRSTAMLLHNPRVGRLQARREIDARLPFEHTANARVVGVSAAHALRGGGHVAALQFHTRDRFDEIDETIDADELAAAEVERRVIRRRHQLLGAGDAVVN